jgi:DNA recombination protein RmuC
MELVLSILVLVLAALVVFMVFQRAPQPVSPLIIDQLNILRRDLENQALQNRREIQQRIDQITNQIQKNSTDNFQVIQTQFKTAQGIIKEVTERLTQLDATNKQVLDFSGQLQSLENILKNPKQRGILGEYFLEALLGNVLQPNQYTMQYKFPNGDIVDAAIFYRDKIIPVDAKFSLEKYNKIMTENDARVREQLEKDFRADVKNRIDETAKYIRPQENTTEFAFMFIPAEGVYYNLLIYNVGSVTVSMQDLIEYAFRKHVIIVSPTSFFAYLETVLQGLKAQKVEENIQEILARVHDLGRHLAQYDDYMQKLGKNLSTAVGSYTTAYRELKKIDKDIYRLTDGESGGSIEPLLIDKPQDE